MKLVNLLFSAVIFVVSSAYAPEFLPFPGTIDAGNLTDEETIQLQRAINEWTVKSRHYVELTITHGNAGADGAVFCDEPSYGTGRMAHTELRQQEPVIVMYCDRIASEVEVHGLSYSDSFYVIVLHELGHAMGIEGHRDTVLMAEKGSITKILEVGVTKKDVRYMREGRHD